MLTKLTPRNLFLVVLGLCLIVAGAWYTFRFKPRQEQISTLTSDLDTLNAKVTGLRSNAAQLPELRATVDKLKLDQAQFVAALPSAANFGSVLDELRLTTAATGAKMTTFTVQNSLVAGLPSGVRPINLNVGVNGKFAQLFQTLRSVETMGRFATVNNVALQLPAADSFDPVLEGTLALTVYTFDPTQAAAPATGTPQAPAAPAAPAPASPAGGTQ